MFPSNHGILVIKARFEINFEEGAYVLHEKYSIRHISFKRLLVQGWTTIGMRKFNRYEYRPNARAVIFLWQIVTVRASPPFRAQWTWLFPKLDRGFRCHRRVNDTFVVRQASSCLFRIINVGRVHASQNEWFEF